jgi:hypothetical protein
MIIVVVHWKIKEGSEYRAAFLRYWEETLKIEKRSRLVGEFLSEPLSPGETEFDLRILGIPEPAPYQSVFNIGISDSIDSFEEQVVRPYVRSNPEPKDFEYEYRSRMVLSPLSWRQGESTLPSTDHFP